MFPRLIEIGNWSLYSYGVILWIAAALGLYVSNFLLRRQHVHLSGFVKFTVLAGCAAVAGARLIPACIAAFNSAPLNWESLQRGGSAQLGIIAAGIVGYLYARKLNVPVLLLFDLYSPGLAIGLAVARLGCFAAGCCYGVSTHQLWGVTYTDPLANQLSGTPLEVPLVPTQLMDSSFQLVTFCLLLFLTYRKRFEGQIVALFLILFGTSRGLLEYVRGDHDPRIAFPIPIDFNQYISLSLVGAGLAIFAIRSTTADRKTDSIPVG